MDVEGYNKLNKRAKEIAFKKAIGATMQHINNIALCLQQEDKDAAITHLDNAANDLLDIRAMALFAKFQDNKKWWMFWR